MSKFLRAALVLLTGFALAACDSDESGASAGAACTGGGDCASGACAPTTDGNICVDACDAVGNCPEGFQCQMTSSGNYCVPGAAGAGNNGGMAGEMGLGGMAGDMSEMDNNEGGQAGGIPGGGNPGGGTPGGGNPGGGIPGGGLDAGAQACQALLQCLNQCGQQDMACQQQCVQAADPLGVERFQAVATCAQQNQCQDDACLNQFCADEVAGCGLGGGGNPGGGGGNLSCGDFYQCASMCAQNDQACIQNCASQLSAEGQQLLGALQQCIQSNNCMDDACVEQNCAAEVGACFEGGAIPGGGGAAGNANCGDFFDCASNCPQGNQQCLQQCFGTLSQEAQALFGDIQMCFTANCNENSPDSCLNDNCDAELRACIGQGRMWGAAGCGASWMCILDCAPMDQACQQNCSDGATEDAWWLLQDVLGCLNTEMCQDPNMCPGCQTEIDACGAN